MSRRIVVPIPNRRRIRPSTIHPWALLWLGTLILCAFCDRKSLAAASPFTWAIQAKGPGRDAGLAMACDGPSAIYVAGEFYRDPIFSGIQLHTPDNCDAFVGKFTMTGDAEWVLQFGSSPGLDRATAVAVGQAHEVFVAGETSGGAWFGTNFFSKSLGKDIFLAKLSPEGKVLWARRSFAQLSAYNPCVAVDATGNAVVSASFMGSAMLGPYSLTSRTRENGGFSSDILLAKYSAAGDVSWVTRAGGSNDDRPLAVTVGRQGEISCCGFTTSKVADFGPFTIRCPNDEVFGFLARYDTTGSVQWVKQIIGNGYNRAYAVVADDDGSAVIAGGFNGTAAFDTVTLTNVCYANHCGDDDAFLARYDTHGTLVWAASGGGQGADSFYGLSIDPDGDIYAVGTTSATGAAFDGVVLKPQPSDARVLIVRCDSQGRFTWGASAGGGGHATATAVCAPDQGTALVTGHFGEFAGPGVASFFGGFTLTNRVTVNFFLSRIDAPPTLSVFKSFDALVVYWTGSTQGFQLEVSEALGDTAQWAKVDSEPLMLGSTHFVATPYWGKQRFFRLTRD